MNISGCWGSRELDDLSVMVGLGIDKAEMQDSVLLTAQIVKPGEIKQSSNEGSQDGSPKPYWNIKRSAPTVFEVLRAFTNNTGKKMYIAHNQVFIFGKDLATEGVQDDIDFFMRAHETRPTSLILVSTGTAGEILDLKPEADKIPALNLALLVNSSNFTSYFKAVNFQEFTARLLSSTTSPIAPLVSISNNGNEKSAYVSGMAVFKRDKMVGTLTPIESRGLLWASDEVKSGVIDLVYPAGDEKVSLEITRAKSKITPEIKDGEIYIHIKIKANTNLAGQTSDENLFQVPIIEELQRLEADIIRMEILAAFEKAKLLNADCFGFGDKIHEQFPSKWKEMNKSWDDIFPEIKLQIEVECKIRSTGLITKPAVPEREK